jgi:hypothetical protein
VSLYIYSLLADFELVGQQMKQLKPVSDVPEIRLKQADRGRPGNLWPPEMVAVSLSCRFPDRGSTVTMASTSG